LRWFGQQAIPLLFERYPAFFSSQSSTRPFVLSVNRIIHPEVRKIYPDANVPAFEFRHAPDGGLMMGYLSPGDYVPWLRDLSRGGHALWRNGDSRASGVHAQRR